MIRETFFLKNHTQNVMKKLVPEPFLKDQNYLCSSKVLYNLYTKLRTIEIY